MRNPFFISVALMLSTLCLSCGPDDEPLGPPDCELEDYVEHEIIEDRDDVEGPGKAVIREVIISRGRPPGILGLTSCDNTGVLSVSIQTPSEDEGEVLGVRLRTATEGLPEGFELPEEIIRAPQGVIDIVWNDQEGQDAFAFDLQASFVDLAGNFGEFSEPFRVEDRGSFF